MKKILTLLTTLSSIPIIGTTTVACADSQSLKIDSIISRELGLTDEKGNGLIHLGISFDFYQNAYWNININSITAEMLLENPNQNGNATARSNQTYNFIKNVLKIEPVSGNYFTDTLFNVELLREIQIQVVPNSISTTTEPSFSSYDFYLASASYKIEFIKGDNVISPQYTVPADLANSDSLIHNFLENNPLSTNDFFISDFQINKPSSLPANGTEINFNSNLNTLVQVFKLLTSSNFKIVVSGRHAQSNYWSYGDYLIINFIFESNNVNFNYNLPISN